MIRCISANHKNTDFELLGIISDNAKTLDTALIQDISCVKGVVPLTTCNRVEFYFDCESESNTQCECNIFESFLEKITANLKLPKDRINQSFSYFSNQAATKHLFRVASGLESVVIGENEISGQVAKALETARRQGITTKKLEFLFQKANNVSKTIKNKITIKATASSLVNLALQLADTRITNWRQSNILILGSGAIAKTVVQELNCLEVDTIQLYSKTGNILLSNSNTNLINITTSQLNSAIKVADIIITATKNSTDNYALKISDFNSLSVKNSPSLNSKLIIDFGLPRNTDPNIYNILGVEILDLHLINLHAQLNQFPTAQKATEIIEDEVEKFTRRLNQLLLEDELLALRSYINNLAATQINIAKARYKNNESASYTAISSIKHLTGSLLYQITSNTKKLSTPAEIIDVKTSLKTLLNLLKSS